MTNPFQQRLKTQGCHYKLRARDADSKSIAGHQLLTTYGWRAQSPASLSLELSLKTFQKQNFNLLPRTLAYRGEGNMRAV